MHRRWQCSVKEVRGPLLSGWCTRWVVPVAPGWSGPNVGALVAGRACHVARLSSTLETASGDAGTENRTSGVNASRKVLVAGRCRWPGRRCVSLFRSRFCRSRSVFEAGLGRRDWSIQSSRLWHCGSPHPHPKFPVEVPHRSVASTFPSILRLPGLTITSTGHAPRRLRSQPHLQAAPDRGYGHDRASPSTTKKTLRWWQPC